MVQALNLPEKSLLRPDEVADFFKLSPKTIYGWIDQGKLEAFKVGGSVRITPAAVEKFMKLTEK